MKHLFAYGTLMCEEIMKEVSGLRPGPVKACLRGYSRRTVRGEHYPAIKPDEQGHVEGVVYMHLPAEAWQRLDHFEGNMYIRVPVHAESEENVLIMAEAYVIKPEFQDILTADEWDYEQFIRSGKTSFRKSYLGFNRT